MTLNEPSTCTTPTKPVLADGRASVIAMLVTVGLLVGPVLALSFIGSVVGPIELIHAADHPITVEGTTHELTFSIPRECIEDTEDPSTTTLTCIDDSNQDVEVRVRAHESIRDLKVAARRGAREAGLNPQALTYDVQTISKTDSEVATTSGQGLLAQSVNSVAIQPHDAPGGFIITTVTNTVDEEDFDQSQHIASRILESIAVHTLPEDTQ